MTPPVGVVVTTLGGLLTTLEAKDVEEALRTYLVADTQHRKVIRLIFQAAAQSVLDELPPTPAPGADAARVVTVCLVSGWRGDIPLLQVLLQYLIDRGQRVVTLAPLLARVKAREGANPSAFDPVWLSSSGVPFFDRTDLRRNLIKLIQEAAGGPILLVQGPDGSYGRSYTSELIAHVSSQSGGVTKTIPVAMSPGTGPTYTIEDLALGLLKPLDIKEPPAKVDSSYGQAVARFVLERLQDAGGQWVIVLDGFKEALDPVKGAIGDLAALVSSEKYRSTIRLVLIGYPSALLPQKISAADFLPENLRPAAQIDKLDLQPVVEEIDRLRISEGLIPLKDGEAPLLVDRMLLDAPADGKERLMSFNAALCGLRTYTE